MKEEFFERLREMTVMVIGDAMIDRYLTGRVARISPEAPVPVVELQSEENRLGGAANVALNLKALGAQPLLCTIIGDDAMGMEFSNLLSGLQLSAAGIFRSKNRKTTVKTRVIAASQQLLRLDSEQVNDLSEMEENLFFELIQNQLEGQKIHAIVLQDYNKGLLTASLIAKIIAAANAANIPVTVDPKKKNFWSYREVALFKPNLKEVRDSVPFTVESNETSLKKAAEFIQDQLGNRATLITLSDKGVFYQTEDVSKIVATHPRSVADVSGAGDTVIAIASLCLAAGLDFDFLATLSNLAGGQVCEKIGVVPVDLEQLKREFLELS